MMMGKAHGWVGYAAALLFAGNALLSNAQSGWRPDKPVEIITPSAAGSSLDSTMRMLQRVLIEQKIVEATVIAVNKPGGGGSVSTHYFDQHAGDAHRIYLSPMTLLNNHILGRSKANFDSYTPLATLFGEDMTMVVQADSPLKSGRDLMARLKADPQSLSIAIGAGRGGTGHLNTALLARAMGADPKLLKTVQFQGNSQALAALLGGHIDVSSMSFAQAWTNQQAGKLRILGIAAAKRGGGVLRDIPTWKEQGLDVEFHNIRFMLGTRSITPEQAAFWEGAFKRVLESKIWEEYATKNHYIPFYAGRADTQKQLAALYRQLKTALTDVGMVQ
ncbi:MAG: tripartite tricarboxylate transporter substrate binding protein [Betaproteobacteria bacterium]|nr:tripartite tricarboxylate transporter substrate binding protein [Betaproteobacteria bacterium]